MIEHQNSFLVHQCLAAVNSGDTDTLRAFLADDIVWQTFGESPWQGEFKGPDQILEYLGRLSETNPEDYKFDIDDIMIGEERAALALAVRVAHGGKTLEAKYVLLARIVGRRVHEILVAPLDSDRVRDFWS